MTVTKAAAVAGVNRSTVYAWQRDDEAFAERFAEAIGERDDALREIIWNRAYVGWQEPVFQLGRQVGEVHKYDSVLLQKLAAAILPEFRERVDVTTNGQAIGATTYSLVLNDPEAAELAARFAEIASPVGIDAGRAGEAERPELPSGDAHWRPEPEAD